MTTVEGGFVSTDDTELHELMRAKRSHGLARECSDEVYTKYIKRYPDVDKRFMFITDGYNFRNNEFGAVLGLSQLPRLDDMIKRRREVCDKFVSILKKYACNENFDFKLFFNLSQNLNNYGFSLGFNGGEDNDILNWKANTFNINRHDNSVDGSTVLTILKTSGNVGIGTTSPYAKLQVSSGSTGEVWTSDANCYSI